ncbi:MAG: DUF3604 domain-containing protein [Planctomycetaceae bacterium]
MHLFWGDLHNHNAVGYAQGSLQRTIDLAREHLDFFAFTGHASWHDMPEMPGDRHLKWVRGFEAHSKHWPKTRRMIHEANGEDFVALLGYEWHSSRFGDYCVIYPEDGELYLPNHADKLLDHTHYHGALAVPHHVGYKQGWRGANWSHFRPHASPVVEVFSEHGCTESDRAAFPMIRHSNGGRSTANTIARQLQRGLRFGFVASSDDHRGYPGAYGEGVVGVWTEELSRRGLFEAIEARRTYAATGDRIALEVTLNEQPMGAALDHVADREIDVRVEAPDSIAMIELVRNGRVIERHFPEDDAREAIELPGRAKCRLQFGWGPWAALGLGRICDWDMRVRIRGGRLLRAWPGFQSAPFDEDRRDRLRIVSETELHLQSATTRVDCYAEDPTKSLVVELEGGPDAVLSVQLSKPAEKTIEARLRDLREENVVEFTGVFTSESLIIGRLVGPTESAARIRWQDRRTERTPPDWYYVRVTQHNGHMAWSSPIWVG